MNSRAREWAEEERRLTAFHEAGHAAMHWFFETSHALQQISLREDEFSTGHVRQSSLVAPLQIAHARKRDFSHAQALAARGVMMNLAGLAAENRVGEFSDGWLQDEIHGKWMDCEVPDPGDDIVMAIRTTQELFGLPADELNWEFLHTSAQWVEEAYDRDGLWAAVNGLAVVLLDREGMSGREACEILDALMERKRPLRVDPWNSRFAPLF